MNRVRHLFTSTLLVMLFFGVSKVTGLIRTILVGDAFGTGQEFDAFTAANQLPELFYVLIAGGALAAAFIPVYSSYLTNERVREGLRLTQTVLTLVIFLLGLIAGLSALFAGQIAAVLTPSFTLEQQQLTAELMRIIFIQTMIFGISGVLSSYLNANQHFALPALASVALDIGYVTGLYLFVPILGIHGLAWGTVVGGLLHITIQLPALVKYGFVYRPRLAWRMAGVQEIVRLMGPRIVTLGTIQFADLFIIRLASGLPEGSVSAYFYAFTLMQLPETLFGTAIALVVFPTMAEMYNAGDMAGLKRTAVTALGIIWLLTIPSAAAVVLLGQPAIAFLLQGGAFTEESTALVYSVLIFFSVRIISEATLEIVARLFYARHNTRTPMFVYLGWLVVQVGGAYLFVDALGVGGLALASTLAFTFLAAVLFVLNQRELGSLNEYGLWRSGGRAVLATAGMVVVILLIDQFISNIVLFLGMSIAVGGVTYFALSYLLGGQEIRQLIGLVRTAVGRVSDS